MKYEEMLYDKIGNEYERKNIYLLELAKLYFELENDKGNTNVNSKINELKNNKDKHPYIIKLNKYKDEEKVFLDKLKVDIDNFEKSLDDSNSAKVKKLKSRLFKAEKKSEFYLPYIDLTYDAQLEYEGSNI